MISRADIELGLKGVALLALLFSIFSYFDQSRKRASDLSVSRALDVAVTYRNDFLPNVQKFQLLLAPYRRVGALHDSNAIDDAAIGRIYAGVILGSGSGVSSNNYADWTRLISFLDSAAVCSASDLCSPDVMDELLCGQLRSFILDISRLIEEHRKVVGPESFGAQAMALCPHSSHKSPDL